MLEELKESGLDQNPIPIPFDETILTKAFDFVKHELQVEQLPDIPKPVPSERLEDCVPQWFADYMRDLPLDDIYDLIACANYLDIKNLVELGCAKVGSLMKNLTITQLREMFHITNDFTPEEERTIIEGKADIWGEEDDEGAETDETSNQIKGTKEEVKISK